MESRAGKAEIRKVARGARRALSVLERALASEAIAERALSLPEVALARSVLAYAALPEEADPAPLVAALRAHGARIALPRVCGPESLSLHWVENETELATGAFSISEPPGTCEVAPVSGLDLVLVPGVAFDRACRRLGFGGGFYDALLASLQPTAAKIGLSFDEQLCAEIPVEDHDVVLDAVVTPQMVFRPQR